LFGKAMATGALAYLVFRLAQVLWRVKEIGPITTPAPLDTLGANSGPYEWGTTRAIGRILFTDYLFPFEAISIVLLVAVIGAIFITHSKAHPGAAPPQGAPQ
jgi:NADH-quinone oxidoreductase subunit J